MSVVVALPGKNEIVVAADTLGYVGEEGGYYAFTGKKTRIVDGKWLIAWAGSDAGRNLLEKLEAEDQGLGPSVSFRRWVETLVDRIRGAYEQAYTNPSGQKPSCSFLVCGFEGSSPQVVTFSIPGHSFPSFSGRPDAIGAKQHGGLYFAHRYHAPDLPRDKRQLLAYFCVREVAGLDPRVDVPVEVAVAEQDSARYLTVEELRALEEGSRVLSQTIMSCFGSPQM